MIQKEKCKFEVDFGYVAFDDLERESCENWHGSARSPTGTSSERQPIYQDEEKSEDLQEETFPFADARSGPLYGITKAATVPIMERKTQPVLQRMSPIPLNSPRSRPIAVVSAVS